MEHLFPTTSTVRGKSLPHSSGSITSPADTRRCCYGRRTTSSAERAHCSFVRFYLPTDEGLPIPLNWVLSNATAQFIWKAFTDEQVSNAAELNRLDAALTRVGGGEAACHRGF